MIQNSSREEADAYMTSAVRRDSLGIGFGVYIARISANRLSGLQGGRGWPAGRPELIRDLQYRVRLVVAA